MWTKDTWPERVEEFLASDQSMKEKYSWPFPMGVFGTLRQAQGNNRRMHAGEVKDHRVGFLPHFYAQGLSIGYHRDSCAPFEVFSYEQDQWNRMIPGVDSLEGFTPSRVTEYSRDWGYFRTLVWIHLLPPDTVNEWFPEMGKSADLWHRRDMKIDPKTWDSYEKVPCWVYSNQSSNRNLITELYHPRGIVPPAINKSMYGQNPLIWPAPLPEEKTEEESTGQFWRKPEYK